MEPQRSPCAPSATGIPRFDSELVYQWPLGWRVAVLVLGVAIMAFAIFMRQERAFPQHGASGLLIDGPMSLVLAGGIGIALTARDRVIFGACAISLRRRYGTRTLDFADIAGVCVTWEEQRQLRGPTIRGLQVRFETSPFDADPISLHVKEGYPLDAAIVERLQALPQLPRGPLELLATSRPDPRPID